MFFHRRIKDRKQLHAAMIDAGHTIPHHEDEEDDFNTAVNTLMLDTAIYSAFESHFDAPAMDTTPTVDTSPSFDPSPSFDAGGGISGGGGADGSW
jgi:hypothetical protein